MGFGPAVGEIVEKGTGGAAGVVGPELFKHGAFESFHQPPVGFFFFQPVQGKSEEIVKRFQIRIRLGRLFDGLGKIGGSKNPGVGSPQSGVGSDDPGFPQVVKSGSARGFPPDFAFVKKIEMAPHGIAGLGRPFGEGADYPMAPGQPDGQEAGFSLPTEME